MGEGLLKSGSRTVVQLKFLTRPPQTLKEFKINFSALIYLFR